METSKPIFYGFVHKDIVRLKEERDKHILLTQSWKTTKKYELRLPV